MPTWTDVVTIGASLPEVQESTSYNTPALKVAGKLLTRLRTESDGGLVVMCGLDEKAALLAQGAPFYTTPHYDGHGSILVDLENVDLPQLTELLRDAWRIKAPAKLRKQFDEI
ncbi:MAG: MmcQ/YjbR family DNA-binding protein [Rhodococcus sp. (in: high G+C Gram-positive bacteria)]